MEKKEIKEQLTTLLEAEKLIDATKPARELIRSFNEIRKKEDEEVAEAIKELGDSSLQLEEEVQKLNREIEELITTFNQRRKAEVEDVKAEQQKHLEAKKAVLQEMKDLIENEENITKAFNTINEIHARWKEIGRVAQDQSEALQKEYSQLNELFFYNINIFKELKDYDLKKNYSLKNQVIHQLKELHTEKSVKKVQARLEVLQDQWAEIGPTFKEAWEDLKEEYWTALKTNLDKVREHYKGLREQNSERLEQKQQVVQEYKAVMEEKPTNRKEWDKLTKLSDELFDKWKAIGFTPKKETEAIWEVFNGLRKEFFDKRKVYFGSLNDEAKDNAEKKRALIEKAEELKNATDRDEAKFELIKLQKEWKNIGYAGKFADQKLWKQFRAACDHFFNALDAERAKANEANAANLKVKNELLKKLTKLKLDTDGKKALEELTAVAQEINAAGPAPDKEWAAFNKSFLDAVKTHLDKIEAGEFAKEKAWLAIRMKAVDGAREPDKIYDRERVNLRKEQARIKSEIIKYETNMGFFGKGAESLLKQVQEKVDQSKARMDQIDRLIKLIP